MCQSKVQKSPGKSRQGTEKSPGKTYLPIPVCRLRRSVVMRSGVDMAEEPYSNTVCRLRRLVVMGSGGAMAEEPYPNNGEAMCVIISNDCGFPSLWAYNFMCIGDR